MKNKTTMQISPHGRFEKLQEDGTRLLQVCDAQAFAAVAADWEARGRPKLLLDYDHARGRAAGWITRIWADPATGLMGDVEYTPAGAAAVEGAEYRFISADWFLGADSRPGRLNGAALTNTPNLPVKPIINSTGAKHDNSAVITQKTEGSIKMEKIKTMLGLPPEADEAAVEAAVQALLDQAKAASEAALEAEAEGVAAANAARVKNSQEFKAAYKKAPDAVKAALAALKDPAQQLPPLRVVNAGEARPPAPVHGGYNTPDEARKALAAQPVGNRAAFYNQHRELIDLIDG